MIVLRIAIVMLIDAPPIEHEPPQQTGIHELIQSAINGRATDMSWLARLGKLLHELLGIEMLVPTEDMLNEVLPLLRDPHSAALQELVEPLLRRESNLDLAQ
jgi:hypothetical protein